MSESGEVKMQIHRIRSPYTDTQFYVDVPDEIPSEKTVECAETGKDIRLEYSASDKDEAAFMLTVVPVQDNHDE